MVRSAAAEAEVRQKGALWSPIKTSCWTAGEPTQRPWRESALWRSVICRQDRLCGGPLYNPRSGSWSVLGATLKRSSGYWVAHDKPRERGRIVLMSEIIKTDGSHWRGPSFCWVFEPVCNEPLPASPEDDVGRVDRTVLALESKRRLAKQFNVFHLAPPQKGRPRRAAPGLAAPRGALPDRAAPCLACRAGPRLAAPGHAPPSLPRFTLSGGRQQTPGRDQPVAG